MSGHTEGPWKHFIAGPNHWIQAESDGRTVAFIGGKDSLFASHADTPHPLNADLIAAAPELLEALKHLDNAINEPSLGIDIIEASDKARAAIAHAEGVTP